MTMLLVVVALLTTAVVGFAAVVGMQVVIARHNLRVAREIRRQSRPQPVDVEEASDAADCLQAWLDSRWKQHYG